MKKLILAILLILAISISAIIILKKRVTPEKSEEVPVYSQIEEELPNTNAHKHPERFIGKYAGCRQFENNSYYNYLLSIEGKHPYECDLYDLDSQLRVSLVNMLGAERFAMLNTFFLLSVPIEVRDNWIVIKNMWPHRAYISATIFIDIKNHLMYVEWIDPDESELFLFYELRKGEEASPETILSREFPKSIKDDICYGLMPDFDPNKTTDFPVR